MGSLDPAKILMILVVVLIVLGPDRLPKVARQLGALWKEVTRIRQEVHDEVRAAMPDLDLPSVPHLPSVRGTLTGFLTDATPPSRAGDAEGAAAEEASVTGDEASTVTAGTGRVEASRSTHPELGDFAPSSDDPSMN